MSIASNIRLYRKKAGITQIDLAEKLGISIATLRRWEAGETTPTGTRINELAEILNVTPENIVASDENFENNYQSLSSLSKNSNSNKNGMLIFEGEGTRVELPPTEKGYEIFKLLIENFIESKKNSNS